MERGVVGVVAGLVLAGVGIGFKFLRKDNTGAEYRKAAHQIVAHVEGYSAKPDYFDWLVDEGHDQCFSNAYHMDFSRRRDNSWVDDDQYLEDIFAWMIDQANTDRAPQVAQALTKYRDRMRNGEPDEADPKP